MKLPLNQFIEYTCPANDGFVEENEQQQIVDYISLWQLPPLPDNWSWKWTITSKEKKSLESGYVGTLPKRISSYYWNEHTIELSPYQMQTIGRYSIAGSDTNENFMFRFVDKFDWEAGSFGDNNSCYFVRSGSPLKVLEQNGVLAVCFYKNKSVGGRNIKEVVSSMTSKSINDTFGLARAWVIQNYPENEMLTIFNGYGFVGDSLLKISRILSLYFSLSYRSVIAYNQGRMNGIVYVNTGSRKESDGTRIVKPRAVILGTTQQLEKFPYETTILELNLKDTSNYYNDEDLEY